MAAGESLLLKKSLDLIATQIEPLIARLTERFGKERALAKANSKAAFKRYYETSIRKCSLTKTLLYRTTPVNLYDFYVDLDVATDSGQLMSTSSVESLLEHHRALLLIGGAGCGKSTLLKHLFLSTIENTGSIPLFIELRRANQLSSTSLVDLIVLISQELNLDVRRDVFVELLHNGRFTIFLDAFDELTRDRAGSIALEINRFVEQHSQVSVIVTSRPNPNTFAGWSFFTESYVQPLTKQRCLELIEKLRYDPDVKEAFSEAVKTRLFASHKSFLTNPLLATLMLMTFEQFGSIDRKMHIFYSQAFDTLYQKHDASKVGYRREMQSALPADEFRALASAFCIQTYARSELSFAPDHALDLVSSAVEMIRLSKNLDRTAFLDDMIMSVCLLIQDGLELTFTHRSLQEYFVASFLLSLPVESRKKLLDEFRARLILDDVAGLLFDMDPFTFEVDFLLPVIEELQRRCGIDDRTRPIDAFLALLENGGGAISASESGWNVLRASSDSVFFLDLCVFIARKYGLPGSSASGAGLNRAIRSARRARAAYDQQSARSSHTREELHDTIVATEKDLADEKVVTILESSQLLIGLRFAMTLPKAIRTRQSDRQRAISALAKLSYGRF